MDLQAQWHVAHLVQKQRAAFGRLDKALLAAVRAGKSPLLVAEQFALEQGLREARAVHHHERAGGALAGLVHRAGKQFLACARLAQQQDRHHGQCHALHGRQRQIECRRAAHQALGTGPR